MRWILPGGAELDDHGDERRVACRPLMAVTVSAPVKRPHPKGPHFLKRCQCRRYGCWGKLAPMKPDSAGRDMKCVDCGCPDWSDPRRL
jgi:hypothetical protein